eukprot:6199981-Pleurochrysis_carterae.AAC.1
MNVQYSVLYKKCSSIEYARRWGQSERPRRARLYIRRAIGVVLSRQVTVRNRNRTVNRSQQMSNGRQLAISIK